MCSTHARIVGDQTGRCLLRQQLLLALGNNLLYSLMHAGMNIGLRTLLSGRHSACNGPWSQIITAAIVNTQFIAGKEKIRIRETSAGDS